MNKERNCHVDFFTKIQEAFPSHLSTLPNKQVGYFVHVQLDKLYKLKNCIDSARTNSDLYKKISKKFISNLRNNVNQMIICCGLEEEARIETSIGLKKNPGIFMIIGISLLDQKYQNDHKSYDVQLSFMESREGKFYDLLSYTKQPLKVTKKNDGYHMNESYFKITTFAHFLKLFKIALFNNKQRDLKTDQPVKRQKIKSSLIMSVITRSYKNGKLKQQKSTLIDFSMEQPQFGQKSQWQYFMIELNNQTSRKKLHYHLVQPNPLINLITSYLKGGQTYILNSFTANMANFEKNYEFMTEFQNIVADILPRVQDNWVDEINQEMIKNEIYRITDLMLESITNRKYDSLREYREIKQYSVQMLQKSIQWNKAVIKMLVKLFQNKRKIKIYEHSLISDQFRLIGSCVKTDHYKDFYQSKSYLSLERQVSIKTQEQIKNLLTLIKERQLLRDQFHEYKNKQLDSIDNHFFQKLQQQHKRQSTTLLPLKCPKKSKNCLSPVSVNEKNLLKKILEFCMRLYHQINFSSMRTISDEVLRESSIEQYLQQINVKLEQAKQQIQNLAKNGKISFQLQSGAKDAHLNLLIKQIHTLMKKTKVKQMPKLNHKNKQNPSKRSKLQSFQMEKSYLNRQTKFTKLPLLENPNECITGKLNLNSLLMNPNDGNGEDCEQKGN